MGENLLEVGRPYWTQGEDNGDWPFNIYSGRYEAARVVKTGPGKLFGFSVYNSGAAQFVLLFDATTVPGSGVAPVMIFPVATLTTLLVGYGDTGRAFNAGCILANSSTANTFTAGAADCWFDAQYL